MQHSAVVIVTNRGRERGEKGRRRDGWEREMKKAMAGLGSRTSGLRNSAGERVFGPWRHAKSDENLCGQIAEWI
jgi:hypothetical protein